jgi:hypothetical protein
VGEAVDRGERASLIAHVADRWLAASPHPGYARPCTPHSSVQAEGLNAEEECGVHLIEIPWF